MTGSTASSSTKRPAKIDHLREMLEARPGASLAALCEATGWQKHSVRAAMSGLRKAGYTIERSGPKAARGGDAIYRITGRPGART